MSNLIRIGFFTVCLCALLCMGAIAQQVIYFENFEKGPATHIDKIKRYPVAPEFVTADGTYPGAFPPPSGRYAVRAQDAEHKYFGLGSVVGGPEIDLTNPTQRYAAIEAKIYIVPSAKSNEANNALIAVDDSGSTEKYYRFGFARSAIYFHYFSGIDFTESLYDPELAEKIMLPGWHTFTMRFAGPNKVYFYVDGKMTFFSPVEQRDVTYFRMGVLGWDRSQCRPILADDFKVMLYTSPPAGSITAPAVKPIAALPRQRITPLVSQPVVWYENTNKALTVARGGEKKFLVLFALPGHALTTSLEQGTLANPQIAAMLNKFVLVKINGRQNRELCERYEIYKFPTLIVMDMRGRVYWRYIGEITPDTFIRSLARF